MKRYHCPVCQREDVRGLRALGSNQPQCLDRHCDRHLAHH